MKNVNTKAAGASLAAVVAAILAAVFSLEAGYSNNPKDPGGATNHGITEAVARKHGYTGSMKDLPKGVATAIYEKDYIEKPGFLPFVSAAPAVGHKLIDAGVNVGPARPKLWLQKSLNAVNRDGKDYPDIKEDGMIGPATVAAYKSLERVRGKYQACTMIIKMLDAQQTIHYMSLTKLEVFTPGWIINRIGNVPFDHCK